MVLAPWSSEGEHVGLDAGVVELDLEQAVADRWRLADQLVHPLVVGGAVAGVVDVEAVGGPGGLAVEPYGEAHGWAPGRWAHHEVEVAGVEPERDGAPWSAELRRFHAESPVAGQCPLVGAQLGRCRVAVAFVGHEAAGRGEPDGAPVAEVALR